MACSGRRFAPQLIGKALGGQRWLVHHDDLLAAVVLLGEMLGVEWEDGYARPAPFPSQ